MTLATLITLSRLLCAPLFAVLAVRYGQSTQTATPDELTRWIAIGIFTLAAASDGLDGFIARKFQQRTKLGAILDPIADKSLLLTGIITLTLIPWGEGWSIPHWFTLLMIIRDIIIIVGIAILYYVNKHVPIKPHWTGKVCTITQMTLLGWVLLQFIPLSPIYPTAIATIFTIWSGIEYFREGLRQIRKTPKTSQ